MTDLAKIPLKEIIANKRLIKILETGAQKLFLSDILKSEFIKLRQRMSNLLISSVFYRSKLDEQRNMNIEGEQNHISISAGYPGSFLSYIINLIKERQFIQQNDVGNMDDLENYINDKVDIMKAKFKSMIEKNQTPEGLKEIWHGLNNKIIAKETIETIMADATLSEFFKDDIDGVVATFETQNNKRKNIRTIRSPTDLDKDIEKEDGEELESIIKQIKAIGATNLAELTGAPINPTYGDYESLIMDMYRETDGIYISPKTPFNFGDISGVKVKCKINDTNHKIQEILCGKMSIKDKTIKISKSEIAKNLYGYPFEIKILTSKKKVNKMLENMYNPEINLDILKVGEVCKFYLKLEQLPTEKKEDNWASVVLVRRKSSFSVKSLSMLMVRDTLAIFDLLQLMGYYQYFFKLK